MPSIPLKSVNVGSIRSFSFLRDPESFRSRQGNISFVKNTISEPLGFKIFWGRMPPDSRSPLPPPQQTRVSGMSFQAQPLAVEIALRLPCYYICVASATDEYCTYSNFV